MADDIEPIKVQAPIQPLKPKDKSKTFWKKAIVAFIVIVMAASSVGFMLDTTSNNTNNKEQLPENAIQVGNYTFYDLGNNAFGTYVVLGNNPKQLVQFRLDPREAGNISLDEKALMDIVSAKKIYITSDPLGKDLGNVAVAAYQISRIIGLSSIPTVGAYTRDSEPPNPDVPLKTCNDATNTTTVIILEAGDFTGVSEKDYCVHISGTNNTEMIKAADKLGMNLLGIRL
jgi:hypothetical protein